MALVLIAFCPACSVEGPPWALSGTRSINLGLKQIGKILKVDDLEYYAARHSWATLAVNKVGIDKYTVHAALNHIDEAMKVTVVINLYLIDI